MRKTSFSTKRATTSNDRLETPSKMIHDGHVLDHPHDHHPFCGWSSHSTSILSFGPPSERQAEFEADHHVSQTAIFAGKSTGRSRHEMTHDKLSLAFLDVFCLLDKKKEHLWCLSSWNCCFFAIIIIVVVVSLSSSLSCLSSRLGHVSPYFGRRRRQDYHSSDCITCHVRKRGEEYKLWTHKESHKRPYKRRTWFSFRFEKPSVSLFGHVFKSWNLCHHRLM